MNGSKTNNTTLTIQAYHIALMVTVISLIGFIAISSSQSAVMMIPDDCDTSLSENMTVITEARINTTGDIETKVRNITVQDCMIVNITNETEWS